LVNRGAAAAPTEAAIETAASAPAAPRLASVCFILILLGHARRSGV